MTEVSIDGMVIGRLSSFLPRRESLGSLVSLNRIRTISCKSEGSASITHMRVYFGAALLSCNPEAETREDFIRSWWPVLLQDSSVAKGKTKRIRKKRVKKALALLFDEKLYFFLEGRRTYQPSP